MSARPSLDRDFLQTLLASAYAVQTSGLDPRSVSALIKIQRFIKNEDFDLDRTMLMLVEHAVEVSNASGVAIALLEGKELVYRAGCGSAANDLGRRVRAVLSVSCGSEVRREILKVENAQIDSRVEAEVCRQFGANSILMLPIYKKQVLFGVLQVQFNEAHSFHEREVRAYRLMLGLLEDGIIRDLHQTRQRSGASSTVEQYSDDSVDSRRLRPAESVMPLLGPTDAAEQKMWSRDNSKRETKKLDHRLAILSALPKLNPAIWKKIDCLANAHFWQVATVLAVSVMLAIATWTVYRNHPAPTTNGPAFSNDRDTGQQLPAKVLLADGEEQLGNGAKPTTAKVSAFRRVRMGPDEVDYVAEDVTIKTFTIRPINRRRLEKEVRIGDDVTVRYFAPSAVPVSSRQHLQ